MFYSRHDMFGEVVEEEETTEEDTEEEEAMQEVARSIAQIKSIQVNPMRRLKRGQTGQGKMENRRHAIIADQYTTI